MEELLGRQAPHSSTAEQAVIGSMLIDTRCIPDVIERLRSAEFYVKQNRDIFETIYAMFSYGQTIDPVTVLDQMKVRGVYTDASTEYIAELMRITPTAANVLEYAAIVRDRALLRNLATAADEINNLVLTKIDRFGTNASMKWDGNILKIEAVDPETNVPYAVEIGGNGIEFKYDNEAVAMINQDQLVIDKTVVLTEMQVNRYWTWRTRDNNNLCLQWIGGSN